MKIVFTANGRCASAAVEPAGQPITAGSRGVPAEIHLSPDYDGLVVTAFFRSEYGAWPVVLGETPGTVTIPWEAMEKKSLTFDVGVVGKNGDGTIVIPTIWARAGKIVPATEDSGLEPGDPSADIGAQIVEQARAAAKKAEDAAAAAEDARDKMPRIVDGTWRVYNAVTGSWEDTGIQAEGQDGVGISSAVLNADYTLTLTFSDGSSYTTPPIRGAQGERGPIGPTPDISIGTVTTGAAGSQAEATMTGTPERPVLNLTIPRGDPGEVTQAEFDELADEVSRQKSAIDDLTALTNRKAGMLVDTASGAIASFVPDSTIPNLLGVSVAVEPVQDLHGFDHPWPGGGGANILDLEAYVKSRTNDYSVDSAGWITINSLGNAGLYANHWFVGELANRSVILLVDSTRTTATNVQIRVYNGTTAVANVTYKDENRQFDYISFNWGQTGSATVKVAVVNAPTISSWTPYSNICPIYGWDAVEVGRTGVNMWDSSAPFDAEGTYGGWFVKNPGGNHITLIDKDQSVSLSGVFFGFTGNGINAVDGYKWAIASGIKQADVTTSDLAYITIYPKTALSAVLARYDVIVTPSASIPTAPSPYAGNTYNIQLGDTVYGGTLDVTNGKLYVFPHFDSYNGEPLVGPWLSSMDVYAEGTTPTVGAEVVDMGGTPTVYDLDPVTISTISGQTNNVWADAGDVTVEFAADLKSYINRLNQPTEDDMIANSLIQSGKYFTINNRLFLSTASIAAGAQIIPGTNCTETSLAAALNALNA